MSIIDTGPQVIFRVTDTGSGIPTELRDRVFERFYRILGTKASGSGLGLAIVSQIAKLHSADIFSLNTTKWQWAAIRCSISQASRLKLAL